MIKQILVVRVKYPDGKGGLRGLRLGKLIAQATHASLKVFLDRNSPPALCSWKLWVDLWPEAEEWVNGTFTKICVKVESEEELLELKAKADQAGLPNALIIDNGNTEFHGVKTATVLAIGPSKSEDLDPITGHLPLL